MKLRISENNDDDDKSKIKTIFNILWYTFLILMVIVIGLVLFFFIMLIPFYIIKGNIYPLATPKEYLNFLIGIFISFD
jgi:hypothetical protein